MPESRRSTVRISVNGRPVEVPAGTSLAAAVAIAGLAATRRSPTGEPRGPLCGMGICFECRATVDGRPQRRTCQAEARDGMEVVVDGG